jgi:exopolysaccharide biosynthesis polyprenyl glycosylphosphotransferase
MNPTIEKPNLGRFIRVVLRAPRSYHGKHREVLAEELFRRILCWERKRAERSRKSFLLMLMDAGPVLQANQKQRVLTRILSGLTCSTRETDIVGWYRESAILAVIFTEIREADRPALQSLVSAKLSEALRTSLGADGVDQIRISFHFFPEDWDKRNTSRLSDEKLYPDLFGRNEAGKCCHLVKRAMDIVGSIIALLLFSPLFALIALGIKLTSKGPVLFKQTRVGRYGTMFTFLKFRSMMPANDPGIHQEYVKRYITGKVDSGCSSRCENVVYKIQEDPRITRVGKFLRKTSLDELPQFINVLKGDMSLVGPRPPIPYELEVYDTWHRRRVLEVKPGITGLWQVNGRSRAKFDDMVRMDLRYARMWSPWLDLKILLQTPHAVLSGDGAY